MTQQALRELVVKWRAEAELHPLKTLAPGGVCPELALEKCADDLEALLGEQREAQAVAIAAEVMVAIRSLRQDVRPYMRHLDDCELVKFRKEGGSPTDFKCPPCSCGLENVLWDLPEVSQGK